MLPRDLLILSFSNSSQPCAKMRFGSGRPAAIRNAGQKIAWKRTISLPIRCRSAGHRSFAFDRAHVVDQRIEPDVEDVVAFHRQRNAPLDRGAADGEIVQALLHEREHFIAARFRQDEVGLLFVELAAASP